MRAHYEALKEHELNIIKDYEGKLQREQIISEQKMKEVQEDIKQGFALRQEVNKVREELREERSKSYEIEEALKAL